MEHALELRAQLRRVRVLVHRGGVLHGGFQQFVVSVRRQRHRAIHLARVFAAIDVFTGHGVLPAPRALGAAGVMEPSTRGAEGIGSGGASQRTR
ncbi:hypothetical protein G6F31_017743 [Rhizopus arrhizus]|nr:hypothetical protein G6F31_017743 [Rhizopus arrhizus]